MTRTQVEGWDAVADATQSAKGIAFDGCHKIYLAMDDEQVRLFRSYGYGTDDDGSVFISAEDTNPSEMFDIIQTWYEDSCFLKFVEAVHTDEDDPNKGFVHLIPQGWDDDEDEEDS